MNATRFPQGNPYTGRFVIQQMDTPLDGEYDTAEAAIAGMRELVESLGWSDLNVWDVEKDEIIASSDD